MRAIAIITLALGVVSMFTYMIKKFTEDKKVKY